MIQHVWERCTQAVGVDRVVVATEDERIASACKAFGAECELSGDHHVSGTDRVAEIADRHPEYEIILNVQGDEPMIAPQTVSAVAHALQSGSAQISTAICAMEHDEDFKNHNVVKVATTLSGEALYFSRSPIPFHRGFDPATRATAFRQS